MITIIAEKPSVAKEIAKIVHASKREDGFISSNKYCVTWAYGHLITLSMPDKYGYEKWNLDSLPILPEKFKLEPINNPGVKKQLNIIKKLFNKSDEIIVATDAGREGELIYRLIHRYLKIRKEKCIKRLWISDLTPESIENGLNNLKDISSYNNLYYSAMSRACADWLVGINFTQSITLNSKKKQPISIGRVQTPTLKIITERYLEKLNFVSKDFFVPGITIVLSNIQIDLYSDDKFFDESNLEQFSILEGKEIELKVERKESNNYPPKLYDLTSLQKDAFSKFNNTAQDTLNIAQGLYEKKLITYPRTDSKYLSQNQVSEVKNLIKKMIELFDIQKVSKTINVNSIDKSQNFDNSKITDHHAIIPTKSLFYNDLDIKEKQIFSLIAKRTIESFSMVSINSNISFLAVALDREFKNSYSTIKFNGWLRIKDHFKEYFSKTDKDKKSLYIKQFDIFKNGKHIVEKVINKKSQTKAPPLFNESSILSAMENSDKYNEGLDENILKNKGIGTPATRASIIETLIKRGFVERKKQTLIPTDFGIGLIKALKGSKVTSTDYTGEIEYQLREIERGNQNLKGFMHETKDFVSRELINIKKAGLKLREHKTEKEIKNNFSFGLCPKCKKGQIRKSKKGAYCENFKDENDKCDFFIFSKIASKRLTDNQIKKLVSHGETNEIKNFVSSKKKKFHAKIKLDNNYKTTFKF
jgi:DNA topoisomerase-3